MKKFSFYFGRTENIFNGKLSKGIRKRFKKETKRLFNVRRISIAFRFFRSLNFHGNFTNCLKPLSNVWRIFEFLF